MLSDLIRKTVFCDPTKNCVVKGRREDWSDLPKSKSLFFAPPDCGLPIGNLTSQLFSNIYLDKFDHFVRDALKMKYYGRYVDDMIFVHQDKELLKSVICEVKEYLRRELGLELHEKKIYLQHYRRGVKFLGAYILPYRSYIANRTKGNFYARIREWNRILALSNNTLSSEQVKSILACANSYLGLMRKYKTSKLQRKMYDLFSVYWWNYAYIEDNIIKRRDNIANIFNLTK